MKKIFPEVVFRLEYFGWGLAKELGGEWAGPDGGEQGLGKFTTPETLVSKPGENKKKKTPKADTANKSEATSIISRIFS